MNDNKNKSTTIYLDTRCYATGMGDNGPALLVLLDNIASEYYGSLYEVAGATIPEVVEGKFTGDNHEDDAASYLAAIAPFKKSL
jgi:hypothetical protein